MRLLPALLLCVCASGGALEAQDSVPPLPPPPPVTPVGGVPEVKLEIPRPAAPRAAPSATTTPATSGQSLPSEADELPRVDSVQAWYYPKGKLTSKARVVLRGVIDVHGRVEPETIALISTSDSTFVAAAKLTFMVTYYRPGRLRGQPVRVMVAQPFSFDGRNGRRCELDRITPMLPPRCW